MCMNNGLYRWFRLNITPVISGKNALLRLCCSAPAVEEEMMNFRTDAAKPQVKLQTADGVDTVSSWSD